MYEDGPFEGELMPAQDRLWRHPAERGAEQAAANMQARRLYGRRWPSMLMSFIAGCSVVGLAWLVQDEPRADINQTTFNVIDEPEPLELLGPLGFDDWANEVAQLNRHAVVGLHLGGQPQNEMAQAIMLADDGFLVTSAHSLIGAEDITAVLQGGDGAPAQLVATDRVSGIAVLKINAPDLAPPTFGNDSRVLVSDRLVALAQHGVDTDSLARPVDVLGDDQVTPLPNGDLLSGLFRLSDDLDTEWAGSAILEDNGSIVAMAVEGRNGNHYGIPISVARRVAQQLIDNGTVEHRAWLGVELSATTNQILERRGLLAGVLVQRVWDETPAAQGGLVAGDIIVGLGPANISDSQDLAEVLRTLEPGDVVEVRFSRSSVPLLSPDETTPESGDLRGQIQTTNVVMGARPA